MGRSLGRRARARTSIARAIRRGYMADTRRGATQVQKGAERVFNPTQAAAITAFNDRVTALGT